MEAERILQQAQDQAREVRAQAQARIRARAVDRPEHFTTLVRFTPSEFEDLHTDVQDVLALKRNADQVFTAEESMRSRAPA